MFFKHNKDGTNGFGRTFMLCDPAPVKDKSYPGFHRQLFSNGLWQCDLPADNHEALCIILERFDLNGGYVELERSDTAEGTIVSEGPEQREWFRAQAIDWLARNPGRSIEHQGPGI